MKNLIGIVYILLSFFAVSCQDEEETVVQDTSNNFTTASPISSLIKRVTQYETTDDNVLDGTSICSIKLPVLVTVNGHAIYVDDSSDFQEVEDAKNNYPGDDVVHFDFSSPLTIIYPDYEEYTVISEAQLDDIFSHYGDDSAYREIKCVDFVYSQIKINVYNTSNQIASTVNISNNEQFYNFIKNLSSTQVVGIKYPIQMHTSGGQDITINNNSELEDAIDEAVSDCSDTTTLTPLADIINSGTWHVSYFYENNIDGTYHYNGYNFTFNANGTLFVVKNATNTQGIWSIDSNNGYKFFTLHFENEDQYLHMLEENWQVQNDYTATHIRLKHEEGGGECYYLDFSKN